MFFFFHWVSPWKCLCPLFGYFYWFGNAVVLPCLLRVEHVSVGNAEQTGVSKKLTHFNDPVLSLILREAWFTPCRSSVLTLTHWHCPGLQCEEPWRAPNLLIAPDMETQREKWISHLCASVCVGWSECQLSNSFHTSLIELDGEEDCVPNWIAETLCCKQC